MGLENALSRAMTVEDLLIDLKRFKPDQKIVFAYDFGDHWHSTVCVGVEELEVGKVKYSDYHNMLKHASDEDKNGEPVEHNPEEVEEVVIINLNG